MQTLKKLALVSLIALSLSGLTVGAAASFPPSDTPIIEIKPGYLWAG